MDATRNRTLFLLIVAIAVSVYLMIWWTVAGTIAAILVLLLTIDNLLLGGRFTKGIYRKAAIRHPFDIRVHPNPDIESIESACIIHASQQEQGLCFSLYMRQELSLQSIRLEFQRNEGVKEELPAITGLFDWYNVKHAKPEDVTLDQVIDGAWYWRYSAGRLRYKQSQTTIGIKCLAPVKFKGVLRFTATFNEVPRKVYDVPFVVIE